MSVKRAWTTSARPELADRICLGGSPPWLHHLCSILVSPGASVGSGFQWGSVGDRQLRSPASFRPSPLFSPATKSQFNKYQNGSTVGSATVISDFGIHFTIISIVTYPIKGAPDSRKFPLFSSVTKSESITPLTSSRMAFASSSKIPHVQTGHLGV